MLIVEDIVKCVPGLSLPTFTSSKGLNGPTYEAVDLAADFDAQDYGKIVPLLWCNDHFDVLVAKGPKEEEEFDLVMQAIVKELHKLKIALRDATDGASADQHFGAASEESSPDTDYAESETDVSERSGDECDEKHLGKLFDAALKKSRHYESDVSLSSLSDEHDVDSCDDATIASDGAESNNGDEDVPQTIDNGNEG
jgi:hypothetical protein